MSHHLVTVCMFCLLCAAHICGSHIDRNEGLSSYERSQDLEHMTLLEEKRREDSRSRYHQKLQKIRHKDRAKREIRHVDPNAFVEKIFNMYGDPKSQTMNLAGFHRVLDELELNKLIEGGAEEKTDRSRGVYGATNDDVANVSIFSLKNLNEAWGINGLFPELSRVVTLRASSDRVHSYVPRELRPSTLRIRGNMIRVASE